MFISDLKVVKNTVIVGDLFKGIFLLDLKENRLNNNKCFLEGPISQTSFMTNCILPLSSENFLVFDTDKNSYIFRRQPLTASDYDKFKLKLTGCVHTGHNISVATFGDLNISLEHFEEAKREGNQDNN